MFLKIGLFIWQISIILCSPIGHQQLELIHSIPSTSSSSPSSPSSPSTPQISSTSPTPPLHPSSTSTSTPFDPAPLPQLTTTAASAIPLKKDWTCAESFRKGATRTTPKFKWIDRLCREIDAKRKLREEEREADERLIKGIMDHLDETVDSLEDKVIESYDDDDEVESEGSGKAKRNLLKRQATDHFNESPVRGVDRGLELIITTTEMINCKECATTTTTMATTMMLQEETTNQPKGQMNGEVKTTTTQIPPIKAPLSTVLLDTTTMRTTGGGGGFVIFESTTSRTGKELMTETPPVRVTPPMHGTKNPIRADPPEEEVVDDSSEDGKAGASSVMVFGILPFCSILLLNLRFFA